MFNWFSKAKSRDNEINHAIDAVIARIEAKLDELGFNSCKYEKSFKGPISHGGGIAGITPREKPVVLAVLSAELVLPIYEKTNNGDSPRKAIELAVKWLNNKSSVTEQELRDAADASYDAADAVRTVYATMAAADAAAEAAHTAADAADAAADAADDFTATQSS